MQRTNWGRAFCPSDSLTVVTDSIRSTWWPTFSCPYDWRERPLWAEWQYVKMALRLSELIVSSQKPTISELTIQLKKWLRGRPFNSWGEGGWFLVIKIFFFWQSGGQDIFSPFFLISFLLHSCCMQFFSSDKCLQEICFQNHPPHPSRVKWSAPNDLEFLKTYLTCNIKFASYWREWMSGAPKPLLTM